jgi:rubredoxin
MPCSSDCKAENHGAKTVSAFVRFVYHPTKFEGLFHRATLPSFVPLIVRTGNRNQIDMSSEYWECPACEWGYDPKDGDPKGGIAPGTAWEDVPDDWACPICSVGKDGFFKVSFA